MMPPEASPGGSSTIRTSEGAHHEEYLFLDSVIRLIERDTAHAIRFARIGAALLLIAVGTLVFGACVLLTGIPLVVLVVTFVICSFIGSQLFGGAILVMEEDRRKQPTRRGKR